PADADRREPLDGRPPRGQPGRRPAAGAGARARAAFHGRAADQGDFARAGRPQPVRRQPAEGRARKVARRVAADLAARRADTRGGRRHEGRRPPDDLAARGRGPVDPADLVGAARAARDERPDPRHARRPPRRSARAGRGDRGANHQRGGRRARGGRVKPATRAFSPQALVAAAFRLREIGIFAALAFVVLLFSIQATNFATLANWRDIATDVAMVIVVAVGETMVVLTRNIDLSVGSIVGLTAYISSNTLAHHNGVPIVVIALLAAAIGLACGIGNGLLVTVGRIPAIIATLATLSIYRGLVFEVTHGTNVLASQLPQGFLDLAAKTPAGLPSLAWIAVATALAGAALLRWAPWARDFYAIGSNPDAARRGGIAVSPPVPTAFAISGALAGLGGFMFAARFAS